MEQIAYLQQSFAATTRNMVALLSFQLFIDISHDTTDWNSQLSPHGGHRTFAIQQKHFLGTSWIQLVNIRASKDLRVIDALWTADVSSHRCSNVQKPDDSSSRATAGQYFISRNCKILLLVFETCALVVLDCLFCAH